MGVQPCSVCQNNGVPLGEASRNRDGNRPADRATSFHLSALRCTTNRAARRREQSEALSYRHACCDLGRVYHWIYRDRHSKTGGWIGAVLQDLLASRQRNRREIALAERSGASGQQSYADTNTGPRPDSSNYESLPQ